MIKKPLILNPQNNRIPIKNPLHGDVALLSRCQGRRFYSIPPNNEHPQAPDNKYPRYMGADI